MKTVLLYKQNYLPTELEDEYGIKKGYTQVLRHSEYHGREVSYYIWLDYNNQPVNWLSVSVRCDPIFVELVESERYPGVRIINIPDGIMFYIEKDGLGEEVVVEDHRTWRLI